MLTLFAGKNSALIDTGGHEQPGHFIIAIASGLLAASHAQRLLPGPERASAIQAVKALTLAAFDGVVVGDRDNAERAVAMCALAHMLEMVVQHILFGLL